MRDKIKRMEGGVHSSPKHLSRRSMYMHFFFGKPRKKLNASSVHPHFTCSSQSMPS